MLEQTVDRIRALSVLRRAGLVEPSRPTMLARSALALRRLGPIAAAIRVGARRSPDKIALVDERGASTYRQVETRCNALAAAWAAHGIRPGDGVGVLCRDHRGAVEAMAACGRLGARLVLLNTGFGPGQLADVADREGVTALVHDEEFADLVAGTSASMPRFIAWHDSDPRPDGTLDELVASHHGGRVPAPRSPGGMVLLTGGTTGTPKGAGRQVRSPLAAAHFLDRIPLRRGDVVHIAAPTFHGTGLSQFIIALSLGATVSFRRRFDALATVRTVEAQRASCLVLVPTMLQRILDLPAAELAGVYLTNLRMIVSAGAPLPTSLGDRAMDTFGPVLHNFYGSTEVGVAAVALPEDWAAAPGTVGRPPSGCRVRLYDERDREVTEPGTTGRILVGNSIAFSGYTGGGTRRSVDGLLDTGDLGHLDPDGRLFVDGRSDDMIVSGGENVFPGEVEDLVATMPGVVEVASTAVEDSDFGHRIRLFVVRSDDTGPDADAIKRHVRTHLARFKVPREVVFLESLPRTATGKVARRQLTA